MPAFFGVVRKARTGAGLPAGPSGLLGAAEGLSFMSVVTGAGVLVGQSACVPIGPQRACAKQACARQNVS